MLADFLGGLKSGDDTSVRYKLKALRGISEALIKQLKVLQDDSIKMTDKFKDLTGMRHPNECPCLD